MLEGLFGNVTVEKIFFFLNAYGEGYPFGMARVFGEPVNRIQQQLKRLENSGIVVSRLVGKVRLYTFNPRYPFLKELKSLLSKAYEFIPKKEKDKYYRMRTRPRRAGKPLWWQRHKK
ncbi:MAG: winged helix-turn-helix domain-containing protein [Thermodesulfovibrionia bacterium]|nr:winged helix-turn-helix domain-containing protein [Thermodesulfovibrionia bacterium]